jgi:hypothetical protein
MNPYSQGRGTVLKTIMMPGQSSLKFITSLKQKKIRQNFRLFVIEGEKAVDELLESGHAIHSIYATVDWVQKHRFQKGAPPREEPFPPRGGLFRSHGKNLFPDPMREMFRESRREILRDPRGGLFRSHGKNLFPDPMRREMNCPGKFLR